MKFTITIVFSFFAFTVFGQTPSKESFIQEVYKDCLYNFKGEVVLSIKCFPIGLFPDNQQYLFTDLDNLPAKIIEELKTNARKDTLTSFWQCELLKNLRCINTDTIDKTIQTRFYKFSRPVFDNTKKYAIISMGYFCGSMCHYYCTYLYKYKNKKWAFVKKVDCGVS